MKRKSTANRLRERKIIPTFSCQIQFPLHKFQDEFASLCQI
jgi:hypothetical protein